MPNAVKTKADESRWRQAKDLVAKEYPDVHESSPRYYKLVMGIFERLKHHEGGSSVSKGEAMQTKPFQISPRTPLQKSYDGTEPAAVVLVRLVIQDDSILKGDPGHERVVMVRRGAAPRAALAALTGGKGHEAIRQLDFALLDRGVIRKALFEALGLESAVATGTTTITKSESEPVKQNAHDRIIAAARALDALVDSYKKEGK